MAEVQQNETNLIINYLPQSLTDEEFRSLFASVGPLKVSKVVRDRATGYSYGFGFVEFVRAADAEHAIQNLNGIELQNKRIKVALSRTGEKAKGANLYVRNVPRSMDASEVEQMFAPYGTIIQCRVLSDKQSGQSKGIGFVLYNTRNEASAAITALNGFTPSGATTAMEVTLAEDNKGKARGPLGNTRGGGVQAVTSRGRGPIGAAPRGGSRGGRGAGYRGSYGGMGAGYGGRGARGVGAGYRGRGRGGGVGFGGGPIRTTITRNRYTPMAGRGARHVGPYGANSYDYDNYADTSYADGGYADGGYADGGYADGYADGSYANASYADGSYADNSYTDNSYGASSYGNGSSGAGGDLVLFAYNIGPDTDEGGLWQLFSPYGVVQKVNVIRDETKNQGKGYGFVTMSSYDEALSAIQALNGYCYTSKPLQVSFKLDKQDQVAAA